MNLYLVEYAINSILRQKSKNIFLFIIMAILTFLLTSMLLISSSIKEELIKTVDGLPSIILQRIKAGKAYDIDIERVDNILTINGVQSATARVWGYYFFRNAGVNFSVVGIDEFDKQYNKTLTKLVEKEDFSKLSQTSSMVIGSGVKKVMTANYYNEYFNFIKPDGNFKKVNISGVFTSDISLESNDIIVMPMDLVREIFDIEEDRATDIVVTVPNPKELRTVVNKIQSLYPDTRIITKEDLKVSYQNIFDYKSGIFLVIFIISFFTFFMVIYDKSSGLSSEEKREIGILKATGWTVDDVLKEKFYESFIISFLAYLIGVILAFIFIYIFNAPILREVFVGYSELKTSFELPFVFDIQTLFLVFFITVPIFISATIIPSWRTATLETDEIIR